jgi:RNA ligase (TIGR02306 family)
MRKLVSIEKIETINPIENADNIEVATVKGWSVVVKKNEFKVNEDAVYFEIDSWIPKDIAPFLCDENNPKFYMGIEGARLRTVKLRGQISQGLLLPVNTVIEKGYNVYESEDLTELLGVYKYEILSTDVSSPKGNFPSFIVKTDEERVQNMSYAKLLGTPFYLSEKLDGSSITVFWRDGQFGVCSRNLELKEDPGSKYWQVVNCYNLREKLDNLGMNIALQGELIGNGIQKNRYQLNGNDVFFFTLFDINTFKKGSYHDFMTLCSELGVKTVPILDTDYCLPEDRKKLIELADGQSVLNPKTLREGFVCRNFDNTLSFKVISNKFLLKEK